MLFNRGNGHLSNPNAAPRVFRINGRGVRLLCEIVIVAVLARTCVRGCRRKTAGSEFCRPGQGNTQNRNSHPFYRMREAKFCSLQSKQTATALYCRAGHAHPSLGVGVRMIPSDQSRTPLIRYGEFSGMESPAGICG